MEDAERKVAAVMKLMDSSGVRLSKTAEERKSVVRETTTSTALSNKSVSLKLSIAVHQDTNNVLSTGNTMAVLMKAVLFTVAHHSLNGMRRSRDVRRSLSVLQDGLNVDFQMMKDVTLLNNVVTTTGAMLLTNVSQAKRFAVPQHPTSTKEI